MVIKKTLLNNQSGQIIWAVIIGFMVASGTMYMLQNNDLALKQYTRLNRTVKLSILGFSTIEKIKMGLAGNLTNCTLPNINAFHNLLSANYSTLTWPVNETDLASIPTCLISSLDKATISTINLKVFSKGMPNKDSLHADIGINLTILGKNGGKFNRSTSVNLSVASLANFGLIQTSQSDSLPLFALPDSPSDRSKIKVQVFAKTFIRNNGDLPLSNLVNGSQITYLSPVYAKSKNLLADGAEISQQQILSQMKEGFYLNSLSSTTDLWTDNTHSDAWKWTMDHEYIYDDSGGYLLPVSNMYIRVGALAPGAYLPPADFNSIRADLSKVQNGGDADNNILNDKNIVETCNSGSSNNLFIYENIDKDLTIDFYDSKLLVTSTDDSRPILCGLVSARNITIKLSNQISHNILFGLFHVSGQIFIQGIGTLDIINPFQQKTLPNDILTILGDPRFVEDQIKNISTYSTTVGRNFTLPIFKDTSSTGDDFKPITPTMLKERFLTKNDCPGFGVTNSGYCWNETYYKPVIDTTFFNNNAEKLVFILEETL